MNYKIVSKYIKKINFNIPNPKIFLLLEKEIPNYKINLDIKNKQFKENIVEVEVSLFLTSLKSDEEKIDVNIVYSAIVELTENKLDKKNLEKIILIQVPSEIYPDLRKTFVFLFEKSGFKQIKIDEKVDFEKLYSLRRVQ